jgi:prefoldin subunit 5
MSSTEDLEQILYRINMLELEVEELKADLKKLIVQLCEKEVIEC